MKHLFYLVCCLFSVSLAADCDNPGPDLQPLIDLYRSTDGSNWVNRSGWDLGDLGLDCDYCNWEGVICDANNRVTSLSLNDNRLRGSLPANFSELDRISRLYLKRANIGSSISVLEGLNRLQVLELYQINYTGPFPEYLTNLPFLSELDLAYNNMNGPVPDLSGLPLLRRLYLDANALTGPPPAFENMDNLREVTMQRNEFEGRIPESWNSENLPRLEVLDVRFGTISGPVPAWLATLAGATIDLGSNRLSGCYSEGLAPFCGNNPPSFIGNADLPSNGADWFFTGQFCQDGESCPPCPNELVVTHDSVLYDFRAIYPNCTSLAGDLRIVGDGISDLRGLGTITSVGGDLLVENTDIADLEGLDMVNSVAGDWTVRNAGLSSVRPLKSINTVGGSVTFQDLPNLSGNGFSGQFSNLDVVGASFKMANLPQLTSLQSFGNLDNVPGTLQLADLDAMTTFDGPGYLSISEVNTLQIYNNDLLEHVDFFRDLVFNRIQNLLITGNPELRNLNGFDEAVRIDRFGVANNAKLAKCAIPPVCLGFDPANPVSLFFRNNAYGCEDTDQVELDCDGNLPLPVELVSFRAYSVAKVNRLEWTVINETDLGYYRVERSTDEGLSWRELARVSAGGAAAGAREVFDEQGRLQLQYAAADPAPVRQTLYRLQMVDLDGSFAFGPVVAVQREAPPEFHVFPNPSSGSFIATIPNDRVTSVVLYNASGRAVWHALDPESTTLRIATDELPSGVYVLRVTAGDRVMGKRVVVR